MINSHIAELYSIQEMEEESNELIDRKIAIDYCSEFDPMYLKIIDVLKK